MTTRAAPSPYGGPPPTLTHLREVNGITGARIHCDPCGRHVVVPLTALGLPDGAPFPAARTARRWRCSRCGGTDVSVMPDWPDPRRIRTATMA